MYDEDKTKEQLIAEIREMRHCVSELNRAQAAAKTAKQHLRDEDIRWRLLIEQSRDGIVILDEAGKVCEANQQFANMLGCSMEELSELHVWDWDAQWNRDHLMEMIRSVDQAGDHFETRHRRKDGTIYHVEISTNGTVYRGRKLIFCVCRDITERRKTEQALSSYNNRLKSLASQLSLAEEKERRRICNLVHEQIGQHLAFAKILLEGLKSEIAASTIEKTLEQVRDLIGCAIRETRNLVSELGSPVLYELGFVPAVEALVRDIQNRHGLKMKFEDDGLHKPLTEEVKFFLFQAIRELLANTVKHSQASASEITVRKNGPMLTVKVEDNGVGFNTEKLSGISDQDKGYGLFSIKERLEPLGGSFKIDSTPQKGTLVTLGAPLKM